MAMTMRTGGLFAAGLLVGVALGGWAVIQAHNKAVWQDNGPGTHAATMGNAPAAASTGTTQTAAAPAQAAPPSAPVVASAVAAKSCDTTAIVPRGREDGQASLQSAPTTATTSEVSALLLTGKEAAASGRMRDAEIVFINACRDAQVVQGKDAALTLADAMYQLGRHYATVAQSGGASRSELLSRSQRLYQAALQTYQVRYGDKGEKTRFAQQGLATVQRLAGGAPLPAAPAVAQAPAPTPAAKPPVKAEVAAKPAAPPRVASVKPAKPEQPRTPAAAAEPTPPRPPAAAVEARVAPMPTKPQERPRAEKPVHEEPAATTSASVAPPKPAPRAEAPRVRREPVHPAAEADTATVATPQPSAPLPQVSVARPRPAPVRVAPPEAESRPIAPMREAPMREAPRRAPRPAEDSGGDETSAPTGTAEGSAGNP